MQQNLRYSITLNDAQLDYLSDEQQDILRMKCLKTFIRMAVLEETKVSGKNYSAVLQPGQFMASKVDLARLIVDRTHRFAGGVRGPHDKITEDGGTRVDPVFHHALPHRGVKRAVRPVRHGTGHPVRVLEVDLGRTRPHGARTKRGLPGRVRVEADVLREALR